jgi:hypothetical protein
MLWRILPMQLVRLAHIGDMRAFDHHGTITNDSSTRVKRDNYSMLYQNGFHMRRLPNRSLLD